MPESALLNDFITETREHLEEMEASLLHLEESPDNKEYLNDIFRASHTIKGAAGFVGIKKTGELAHKLEDLLEIIRYSEKPPGKRILETLIESKDRIEAIVNELAETGEEISSTDDLIDRIETLTASYVMESNTEESPEEAKMDAGFEQIENGGEDYSKDPITSDDDYDEEYDKELFEIFQQHLQDTLVPLIDKIRLIAETDDQNGILLQCIEYLDSLHSSANYMGYEGLAGLYEKWRDEIGRGQEMLSMDSSDGLDPQGFHMLMRYYVQEVVRRFPKMEYLLERLDSPETIPTEQLKSKLPDGSVQFDVEEDFSPEIPDGMETDDISPFDAIKDIQAFDFGKSEDDLLPHGEFESSGSEDEPAALYEELDDVFGVDESIDDELEETFDDLADTSLVPDVFEKEKNVEVPENTEISNQDKKRLQGVEQKIPEKPSVPVSPQQSEKKEKNAPKIEVHPEVAIKHSLRVDADKIDSLMNQVGELVVSRAWFSQLYQEMKDLQDFLNSTGRLDQREMKPVKAITFRISEATVNLGRVANDLQEGVMKIRMLPISQLFNRYPRLVRDLTHNSDKRINLDIVGEETELDKMVIEEIADPLIHIIRNAVDHGCESVSERKAAGKPEVCTLKLESYHESNHVVIEIADDGRGINIAQVKKKALDLNLFSLDELDRMGPRELLGVIMKPGFSTAETISDTSGRGVGMDVVKKNIEKLNGSIEIDSREGTGTRFKIKIPLTLAIIQALLISVGDEIFTVPLSAVEETLRVFENDVTWMEGVEVIHLRDYVLPLLRLSEIFGIPAKKDKDKVFVVVVNSGMRNVGLVVDKMIGQEEVVIKPLVDYLQESSGFSGATILGDGKISLILDIYELINLSIQKQLRKNKAIGPLGAIPSDFFSNVQGPLTNETIH